MDFWQVPYFFLEVKVHFDVFLRTSLMLLNWLQLNKQDRKRTKWALAMLWHTMAEAECNVSSDWRWLQNCCSVLSFALLSPKHWRVNILYFLENFCIFLCYHYKILKFPTRFSVLRIWNPRAFWCTWNFLES